MKYNFLNYKSSDQNISWPAIPSEKASILLSLLHQMGYTENWSEERLKKKQFKQLEKLLKHSQDTVPYYKNRLKNIDLSNGLDEKEWSKVPILKRYDIQTKSNVLTSLSPPKGHGKAFKVQTSGSTGMPIQSWKTSLMHRLWEAITVRDHLWHDRDIRKKLVAIRKSTSKKAKYPTGLETSHWGNASGRTFHTGPAAILDIATDINDQLSWLQSQKFDYLLTYPTNLRNLILEAKQQNIAFPDLKGIQTIAETVPDQLRTLCKSEWGIDLKDIYSTQEVGHIALQCPDNSHYHIMMDTVKVEILDDQSNPVKPGEAGKIIITPLHNFYMPLLRYEIGDYAELGHSCSCGRGLTVLNKIMGRKRNIVHTPDGKKYWPVLRLPDLLKIAPISQLQIIQQTKNNIEVKIIKKDNVYPNQEKEMIKCLQKMLGYNFQIKLTYVDKIERSKGGKYEDFISKIAD